MFKNTDYASSVERSERSARALFVSEVLDDLQDNCAIILPAKREHRRIRFDDPLNNHFPGVDSFIDSVPRCR